MDIIKSWHEPGRDYGLVEPEVKPEVIGIFQSHKKNRMIEHVVPSRAENMEMDPYVNPYSRPEKTGRGSSAGSGREAPVAPKRKSLENLDEIGQTSPPMTIYTASGAQMPSTSTTNQLYTPTSPTGSQNTGSSSINRFKQPSFTVYGNVQPQRLPSDPNESYLQPAERNSSKGVSHTYYVKIY